MAKSPLHYLGAIVLTVRTTQPMHHYLPIMQRRSSYYRQYYIARDLTSLHLPAAFELR